MNSVTALIRRLKLRRINVSVTSSKYATLPRDGKQLTLFIYLKGHNCDAHG